MQDRYAGDIGDFGKIALLRAIQSQNVGTVYLYKIDTLYNIFLTVHGTSTG